MKPRHQNFLSLTGRASKLLGLCTITFSVLTAGHAADVNTTGGTTALNIDNPQNKYIGNGILQISADGGDNRIFVGSAFNTPVTEFAMISGGLITIDSGVGLVNGGFSRGVWTNNLAVCQNGIPVQQHGSKLDRSQDQREGYSHIGLECGLRRNQRI